MQRADTELVVIQKARELLVWTLKHIEKFPRNHRYGVTRHLEQRLKIRSPASGGCEPLVVTHQFDAWFALKGQQHISLGQSAASPQEWFDFMPSALKGRNKAGCILLRVVSPFQGSEGSCD